MTPSNNQGSATQSYRRAGYSPATIVDALHKIAGHQIDEETAQYLSYLAHGWNLAMRSTPLIAGGFTAGPKGPRCLATSNDEKHEIRNDDLALLKTVWSRYGKIPAHHLSRMMIMRGTPWAHAQCSEPMSDEETRQYFLHLAIASRRQNNQTLH